MLISILGKEICYWAALLSAIVHASETWLSASLKSLEPAYRALKCCRMSDLIQLGLQIYGC